MSTYEPLIFICAFFFIYAFAGWCSEVAYHALCEGNFVNRGMLAGPVCPIYGFGMLLILWIAEPFTYSWPLTFLVAMVICSLLELAAGLVLRWLFHAQWWDYSNEPFNIAGLICLRFSILWGIGGAFLIKVVHPTIAHLVDWLPLWLLLCLVLAASVTILLDCIITVRGLMHFKHQHELLFDVEAQMRETSAEIGTTVTEWTLDAVERLESVEAKLHAFQVAQKDNLDDAKEALEALLDELEQSQKERAERQEEVLQGYVDRMVSAQASLPLHREMRLRALHDLHDRLTVLDDKRKALKANRPFTEKRLKKAFPHLKWMDKK